MSVLFRPYALVSLDLFRLERLIGQAVWLGSSMEITTERKQREIRLVGGVLVYEIRRSKV